MFKPLRLSFYTLGALFLALTSCASPTASSPELGDAKNLVATAGGESVTLAWDSVANATGYTVWYTSDGSTPTSASSSKAVAGTTLTQTGLNAALTYKYAIQPTASGYSSKVGTSVMVQPLNVMTFTIGQAGANQAVLVRSFYATTSADWTNDTYKTGTVSYGIADASGAITLVLTIDRVNQWGWTVVLDNDNSHTLTTGDTVWGTGATGVFTFLYLSAPVTTSQIRTYNPWNTRGTTTDSHFY